MSRVNIPVWSAAMLRRDLSARAHRHATAHKALYDLSTGSSPVVIFGRDEQGRHGNFHPETYAKICANPAWLCRLTKVHTSSRQSRARKDWRWMELDSVNSSDALLMNIFCHPGVFDDDRLTSAIANLLNVDAASQPCFGINPGVPLLNGHVDRTEVDLRLDSLFLEAKLTETSFQTCGLRLIERYRDLETVFEVANLPRKQSNAEIIDGYQLIRNVLAAFASDASFCVLCDARRRDLIETWYSVLSAVHYPSFAWRLKLLTWQELAAVLPTDLQQFLDTKYGIAPY